MSNVECRMSSVEVGSGTEKDQDYALALALALALAWAWAMLQCNGKSKSKPTNWQIDQQTDRQARRLAMGRQCVVKVASQEIIANAYRMLFLQTACLCWLVACGTCYCCPPYCTCKPSHVCMHVCKCSVGITTVLSACGLTPNSASQWTVLLSIRASRFLMHFQKCELVCCSFFGFFCGETHRGQMEMPRLADRTDRCGWPSCSLLRVVHPSPLSATKTGVVLKDPSATAKENNIVKSRYNTPCMWDF